MLGLYDSGLGGLTVLAALRAAGIDQDVVYFADQAHVPYGDRSDAQIHGFLGENLAQLAALGVDAVVTACNTTCAVAQRLGWPATRFPVLDLIASAGASFAGTAHRRVVVLATAATVRSGAYGRAIRAAAPHVDVVEVAAPALVPLVERGAADEPEARDAVRDAVSAIPGAYDALVYGCTHYPMLDRRFAEALPPRVERIDPARSQAAATRALIGRLALPAGARRTTYYTNGDVDAFTGALRRWNGDAAADVRALVALG
ncbi:MAG TPA: glutamate racemase [Candidatus Baltobacteraceae bacterium]|nr:glutamate racemase [Candidatus Baltobacteraceae bacterium]